MNLKNRSLRKINTVHAKVNFDGVLSKIREEEGGDFFCIVANGIHVDNSSRETYHVKV